MTLFELLNAQNNELTNHDLATLADWANAQKSAVPNHEWKKAFALIREGADLLLRRRARSTMMTDAPKDRCVPVTTVVEPYEPEVHSHPEQMDQSICSTSPDYLTLRKQLDDFKSTFYGPHYCPGCSPVLRNMVITRAKEQGGQSYEWSDEVKAYILHHCRTTGRHVGETTAIATA